MSNSEGPDPASTTAGSDAIDVGSARRAKCVAAIISVAVVTLMLLPLLQNAREKGRDAFPFSFYPMFTKKRGETVKIRHVVAFLNDGSRIAVPYRLLGRGGMNQVRKQISRDVKRGNAGELCKRAVKKVVRRKSFQGVYRVEVVTASYRLADYTAGKLHPVEWRVEAKRTVKARSS